MELFDEQALAEGRRDAESVMTDRCTISRSAGHVTDPDTAVVSEVRSAVYAGKCRVQGREAQATTPESGGHLYTVEKLMVYLPMTAEVRTDDYVLVEQALSDSTLVGLNFRLVDLARGSQRTARRWNVERVAA